MRPSLPLAGLLALALLPACSPVIEGACAADADCKTGTVCVKEAGADEGLCVTSGPVTCGLPCGEGFRCVLGPDAGEACEPNPGEEGVATVTAPETGAAVTGVVQVTCKVVAKQLRGVTISIREAEGAEVPVPAPVAVDGAYVVAWDTTTSREGRYEVACRAAHGPEGRTRPVEATPAQVLVDRTTPKLRQRTPADWVPQAGELAFEFEATDDGSGLVPESVVVTSAGLGTVVAAAKGQGAWVARIDLARLQPPGGEGPVALSVAATDRAGNTGRAEMNLAVDGKPPRVEPVHDQPWRAYDGGPFTLTASTFASGAPMDGGSARFVGPDGYEVAGTFSGETVAFVLDPRRLGAAGAEQQVQGAIAVADVVGQRHETPVVLPVDGRGPSVVLTPAPGWRRRGDVVDVRVTASDSGLGVDPAAVRVRGGAACVADGAGGFTCSVSTSTAPAGVETPAYSFAVDALDAGGNPGSAAATLSVDDVPPLLSFAAGAPAFVARGQPHVVQGRASDVGAGLDAASVRVVVGSRSYAGTYDASSGAVAVPTAPAEFSPAGQTTSATVTLAVKDLAGLEAFVSRTLVVDDQAPQLVVGAPTYPHTDASGPYAQRNESVTFTAAVTDPASGAGVDPASVRARYTKRDGTSGTAAGVLSSGATYRFAVPASDLALTASTDAALARLARATAALEVEAADLMGNRASAGLTVTVSRKLWEFDTGAGARVIGSVAIDGSNAYLAVARAGAAAAHNVFAVARGTGTKAWSTHTAGTPLTPVTVGQGRLYLVASDAQGAYLDGWTLAGAAAIASRCGGFGSVGEGAALALGRYTWAGAGIVDTLFVGSSLNCVYAIAPDAACRSVGTIIPSPSDASAGYDPSRSAISIDGTRHNVWFGHLDGRVGVVPINVSAGTFSFGAPAYRGDPGLAQPGVAVTESGLGLSIARSKLQLWSASSATPAWESAILGASSVTAPGVVYGELGSVGTYGFGSEAGRLHAIHSVNGPIAGYPHDAGSAVRGSPALDVQSTAYVVTADGLVRAVGYDGRTRWVYDTGAANVASQSPVLACDGTLYVGTGNGKVVALSADGAGLVNTAWPRFQHDNRNTGNTSTALRVAGACVD